jgi:DNA-binding response OmpR family regulator
VQVAHTAEQGIQLARTRGFDLITLNIVLPGTSGFEVCRRLKQIPRLHDAPVIFVSGHTSEKDQKRAFDLGAVDYIEKPFDAQDFVSRILSQVKIERDSDLVEVLGESSMA